MVHLSALMDVTQGVPEVVIGLLDGPVATGHPELAGGRVRLLGDGGRCDGPACGHGTFVTGVLAARRGGRAPAICPGCTVLVRPVFGEPATGGDATPSTTPRQLAVAIGECVDAGARVLNLSAGMARPSTGHHQDLHSALDHAARRGVLVIAAAGNQGTLGSSAITRHPWVIPVVGYGHDGRPTPQSNLGSSAGGHGLGAPGENVTSLAPHGAPDTRSGTSVATAFVTGAIALLWSLLPEASAAEVKYAVTGSGRRRTSVVPPLLDARAAWQALAGIRSARSTT
ncbi:S8 family peptidase [Streptomyces sp. NPDC002067]